VVERQVAEVAQDVEDLEKDHREVDAEKPNKKHEKAVTAG